MIPAILLAAILCVVMVLPYLPGRFDASAAMFSFVVQIGSYVSLLMIPVGLAWMVNRRRSRLWHRLALALVGLVALVATIAAVAVNQLAIGVLLGVGAVILPWSAYRRSQTDSERVGHKRNSMPFYLVCVPLVLVAFRTTVLPRAADWSRDRAIRHSAALIAEIESFRQRRGHYPVSLQSLHPDFPTGVVGIERFHYEPNGEAYNLYFVRRHIALDAEEARRVQHSRRAPLHGSRVGYPSVRWRAAGPASRRPAPHSVGPLPLDFDPSRLRRFERGCHTRSA